MTSSDDLLWDLDLVDWSSHATAGSESASLPMALALLANAKSEQEATDAYWRLDNVVVIQNRLYPAALAVAPYAIRIALGGQVTPRRKALELLIQISSAESAVPAASTADLIASCRDAVRAGLPVYYWLLRDDDPETRRWSLWLLALVEPSWNKLIARIGLLERLESDSAVLQLMKRIASDPPDRWRLEGDW